MRKPVIGIMGITAGLYKKKFPEFVADLEKKYRDFIHNCLRFVDIAEFSLVYEREMVEKSYKRMLDLDVDGIIIVFFSYGPSLIIAPAFKKNKIPVLIWNTQHLFEIDSGFSVSDMMNNHGMHGVQDLCCVLLRQDVPFSIVTGHYMQSDTVESLIKWCRASAVFHDLKRLKVGRIGGKFKDMGDFSVPDTMIGKILGPRIINIKLEEFKRYARAISNKAIEKIMAEEERQFKIDVDRETRYISSRMELTLRNLIKKYELQAIALNFTAFNGRKFTESIPFAAISKLISEGAGYGGEGDVLCAISVWIVQKIAGQATFTEMFTTDYKNNRIFMSHMGESNFLMAKNPGEIRLIKKDMNITAPGSSTSMFLFQMKPGQVTLFNIAPGKEKFHCIATKAWIEDQILFPEVLSPHFILKVSRDVRDFLTDYSKAGGTHHLAMAYGDYIDNLRVFAQVSGLQFIEI